MKTAGGICILKSLFKSCKCSLKCWALSTSFIQIYLYPSEYRIHIFDLFSLYFMFQLILALSCLWPFGFGQSDEGCIDFSDSTILCVPLLILSSLFICLTVTIFKGIFYNEAAEKISKTLNIFIILKGSIIGLICAFLFAHNGVLIDWIILTIDLIPALLFIIFVYLHLRKISSVGEDNQVRTTSHSQLIAKNSHILIV